MYVGGVIHTLFTLTKLIAGRVDILYNREGGVIFVKVML